LESKSSSRKFCLFENLATKAGDEEANVDIISLPSKVVQHLGGLRKQFVLLPTIPKSSKQTWIW